MSDHCGYCGSRLCNHGNCPECRPCRHCSGGDREDKFFGYETMKNPCRVCNQAEYEFSSYCGAWVCPECGDHKGLARCFCGWGLASGEKLEDDVGCSRFVEGFWKVDY